MPQPESDEKNGGVLPKSRTDVLIAVGSNEPLVDSDVRETVEKAVLRIAEEVGVIRSVSRLFRTPAFPPGAGPDFLNAAVAVETGMTPAQVLHGLHAIEAQFGRERRQRWAARTLDLDLIAFGDAVLPDVKTYQKWVDLPLDAQMEHAPDQLIVPHPRLAERAFVLVPLNDVAPDWRHPVSGLSVAEMLQTLPAEDVMQVVPQ